MSTRRIRALASSVILAGGLLLGRPAPAYADDELATMDKSCQCTDSGSELICCYWDSAGNFIGCFHWPGGC